jgi:hypothetical protein
LAGLKSVMAGLVPAIGVFPSLCCDKTPADAMLFSREALRFRSSFMQSCGGK